MFQQPRVQLQGDYAHGAALTLQHAAGADQRQQVISDRECPVVAGRYEAQVHARLYHDFKLRGLPITQVSRAALECNTAGAEPATSPGLGRPPFEAGRAGGRATRNSSKSRDVVLDPFGGLGSTLIACEKTGRQARLIELDPRYCDVIVRRWQEWTSEVATLDGRPFEEVAAARATPEQAER